MGMGVAGINDYHQYHINIYYGSFPHSLRFAPDCHGGFLKINSATSSLVDIPGGSVAPKTVRKFLLFDNDVPKNLLLDGSISNRR